MRGARCWFGRGLVALGLLLGLAACEPAALQIVPTARPTLTATPPPTASPTDDPRVTPTTARPTATATIAGGPSATPLFGPSRTPRPDQPTATRAYNPFAPVIEFFTSDVLSVAPGEEVTLFWSVRNVDGAVIYRLLPDGTRSEVWNVPPDSRLTIPTRARDRGDLVFLLTVGEGEAYSEQRLTVPIRCPVVWFFSPAPPACAVDEARPVTLTEQTFERGRMVHVEADQRIYVLFNDGRTPAWLSFIDRYDPAIHPESVADFPPGGVQPIAALGFLWRADETVRNRLGLGTQEAITFEGFTQEASDVSDPGMFISSADGTVLKLVPGNETWQIISP
jgi:hypothetical protein